MSKEAKDEAPKKKGKLPILILAAVLLLGGGGAGAWFFLKPAHDTETAEHVEEAKPRPKPRKANTTPPVFVNIDPFLFNLRDTEQDRFAQIAVVLEVEEASVEAEIKTVAPAVRNALLMLMSSKTSEELLSVRGKQELSAQVVEATNAIIAGDRPPPIEPSRASRSRNDDRARDIASSRDHGGAADADDGHDRDAHDDRRSDRYDDRYDRRPWYPERVIAAHFSQFIVQ